MEYQILTSRSPQALQVLVGLFLNEGWKPAGGLSVVPAPGAPFYHQAVFRGE